MQSAKARHGIASRPQHQVVRITKQYLNGELLELFRRHSLYRCLSANGHEHRSFNNTMRQMETPATGTRSGVLAEKLEFHEV
jgi:hypothetical protein